MNSCPSQSLLLPPKLAPLASWVIWLSPLVTSSDPEFNSWSSGPVIRTWIRYLSTGRSSCMSIIQLMVMLFSVNGRLVIEGIFGIPVRTVYKIKGTHNRNYTALQLPVILARWAAVTMCSSYVENFQREVKWLTAPFFRLERKFVHDCSTANAYGRCLVHTDYLENSLVATLQSNSYCQISKSSLLQSFLLSWLYNIISAHTLL